MNKRGLRCDTPPNVKKKGKQIKIKKNMFPFSNPYKPYIYSKTGNFIVLNSQIPNKSIQN